MQRIRFDEIPQHQPHLPAKSSLKLRLQILTNDFFVFTRPYHGMCWVLFVVHLSTVKLHTSKLLFVNSVHKGGKHQFCSQR